MEFLKDLQLRLEDTYGASTGLNVLDFIRTTSSFSQLGELLVEQEASGDLNLAVLFDRDILDAWKVAEDLKRRDRFSAGTWTGTRDLPDASKYNALAVAQHRFASVPFEEISHFVYLSFNHQRGRSVTGLEMELQSEVDRVLLAFHGPHTLSPEICQELLCEVLDRPYPCPESRYETARRAASRFLRTLGHKPEAWSRNEFALLREFFHNDLGGKLHMAGSAQP